MEDIRLLGVIYDEVDGSIVGVMDRGGRRANQISCSSGQNTVRTINVGEGETLVSI